MKIHHPVWCARAERAGEEHASATVHAAAPDDIIDISLRRFQILSSTPATVVEVAFVDDETVTAHVLPLDQVRALAHALNEITRSADAELSAVRDDWPRFRNIAERLRARVVSGEFELWLPSDATLAEEYGVARNTMRKALRVLADDGTIRIFHRRGCMITQGRARLNAN